jgi:hypothetical protein
MGIKKPELDAEPESVKKVANMFRQKAISISE